MHGKLGCLTEHHGLAVVELWQTKKGHFRRGGTYVFDMANHKGLTSGCFMHGCLKEHGLAVVGLVSLSIIACYGCILVYVDSNGTTVIFNRLHCTS